MKKITSLLIVAFLMLTAFMHAQGTLNGTVVDGETNTRLPGVNVVVEGTSQGVSTDFDGNFKINVASESGVLKISYLGFQKKTINFNVSSGETKSLGNIMLVTDADALSEVVVIGKGVVDVAIGRQTPVAVSTVTSRDIEKRAGNEEFPTLLRSMPSVYANTSTGGYGDSEVRIRGFDQSNTAVLLNGQPINGMEDGNMYWSNWQGVRDVASAVQVQRGLGASKLAISSVGGTINIVTQSYNNVERGYAEQAIANGNYTKSTAYYTTGSNDLGWSSTYMLSYWQGDGNFYKATAGKGLTYFFSVGYKPSEDHAFNLLFTGAPQTHGQSYQNSIGDALEYGRDYNSNWGYKNGSVYNERTNFYHKPVVNLNWDWNISDDSYLSTVAYASFGKGGGTGPFGSYNNKTNDQGQINFDEIIQANKGLAATQIGGEDYIIGADPSLGGTNKGYLTRASMNNHFWTGLVSNFNHKINDNLEFNVGVDARHYHGDHYRVVTDFLGLDGYYEDGNGSRPGPVFESFNVNLFDPTFTNPRADQHIDYSYSENISYIGGFGQVEYKNDDFSAFVQGALSNQRHQRFDYFNYVLPADQESVVVNNGGYNVKGGFNFNINENHNVFVNAGHYSRQPFHDNIFLNFKNDLNPLTENESISSVEVGYGFTSRYFSANVNGYATKWSNRVDTQSQRLDLDNDGTDENYFANFAGIEQTHYGVEVDFRSNPISNLTVKGFVSLGHWEYSDNARQSLFDQDDLSPVEGLSGVTSYVDGKKIGNAPQTSINLGLQYNILDNLSFDADWFYYADLYADIDPLSFTDPDVDNAVIKLPNYDITRIGLSYRVQLEGRKSLNFRLNVDNLFDEVYLNNLLTNRQVTADSELYRGVNVSNRGTFGLNRQWSASVRFNF